MINNDVLRSLRFALKLKNSDIIDICRLAGMEMTFETLDTFLKRDNEEGYIECSNETLNLFLDGLIIKHRGVSDNTPQKTDKSHITNNLILKKIRIALMLKDVDILEILVIGEMKLTKSELSALFRNEGHRNFKPCGDQILRKFLSGLSHKQKYLEQCCQ
jgi:uncharacterized protein YehS (DUF1456 family)